LGSQFRSIYLHFSALILVNFNVTTKEITMNQSILSAFGTTGEERVINALNACKQGNGVLVLDDEDRENEGDLIFPAETITPEQMAKLNARLVVGHVEDSIAKGTVVLRKETDSRNAAQAVTLLETIAENGFDALMGGARRDEEKARAKERIFSFRDEFGQWDPKAQRPELWSLYNAKLHKGENMRVFPISNWTELDIWQYIARENLELPPIYYSHKREVVRRKGLLVPVTPLTPKLPNEVSEVLDVRFRTVGDISCTCPVASTASTPLEIIEETAIADISERSATRLDDQASEAAMEKRKKEGYF